MRSGVGSRAYLFQLLFGFYQPKAETNNPSGELAFENLER
jgi:hypothetical protein